MRVFIVKQTEDSWYKVADIFSDYSPVEYDSYAKVLDLCRIRTGKTLTNDVSIFKVPFVPMWIVW